MSEVGTAISVEVAAGAALDAAWHHDWGEVDGPGGGTAWYWDSADSGVDFAGTGGTFTLKDYQNGYPDVPYGYNNDLAAWHYRPSMQTPAVFTFRVRFRGGPVARPTGNPYNHTELYFDVADSDVRTGLSNLNQYWDLYLYTGPGGGGNQHQDHLYGLVSWWGGSNFLNAGDFDGLTPMHQNVWDVWLDVRVEAQRNRCDVYVTKDGVTKHMWIEVEPPADYDQLNRIHEVSFGSIGYVVNTVGTGYVDIAGFAEQYSETGSMERFDTPVEDGWGVLPFASGPAEVVGGIAAVTDRQYGLYDDWNPVGLDSAETGWLGVGRLDAQCVRTWLVLDAFSRTSSSNDWGPADADAAITGSPAWQNSIIEG